MKNFEVIIGDVEYDWSLGVFSSQTEAETKVATFAELLAEDGHEDGDHEFAIVATDKSLRGAVWPGES